MLVGPVGGLVFPVIVELGPEGHCAILHAHTSHEHNAASPAAVYTPACWVLLGILWKKGKQVATQSLVLQRKRDRCSAHHPAQQALSNITRLPVAQRYGHKYASSWQGMLQGSTSDMHTHAMCLCGDTAPDFILVPAKEVSVQVGESLRSWPYLSMSHYVHPKCTGHVT